MVFGVSGSAPTPIRTCQIKKDQLVEVQRHHRHQAFPADEQRDLRIQRMTSGPIVELVQPGAEQKDQGAEEVAREQEGDPGFCAGEVGISIYDRVSFHFDIVSGRFPCAPNYGFEICLCIGSRCFQSPSVSHFLR